MNKKLVYACAAIVLLYLLSFALIRSFDDKVANIKLDKNNEVGFSKLMKCSFPPQLMDWTNNSVKIISTFSTTRVLLIKPCRNTKIKILANSFYIKSPPYVVVYENNNIKKMQNIYKQSDIEVVAKQNQITSFVFYNFFYKYDVRLVRIFQPTLRGNGCDSIGTDLNQNVEGINWDYGGNYGSIYGSVPLQLVPCSPGTLSFSALGQKGVGEWPIISIGQENKIVYENTLRDRQFNIKIPVDQKIIKIGLKNPKATPIEERRVTIDSVEMEEINYEE